MQLCPSCGRETPEGFPRCANCGAELSAEPLRQERKVVTVLFCDLVGFTSRAEAMDPEDVRALLAPYHEHVRGELERFGGTVEKFIGDAVMAVFGAPVSHEDDPERAVRAALAIRDWAAEEGIGLRIGVNTGEALVTIGGEPLATGDVVNTAARLQTAAPTGGVLAGEGTYRATRDRIDYDEPEQAQMKGKSEPVPVWLAREPRSRVSVERAHGAALVGRERELRALVDALEGAQADRQAQLVTLVGVPGIGKSRLVYELFKVIETARFGLVYWRHGRCLPYGDGVSFWALGEIVKAQAGILDSDPPEEVERKLVEAAGDPWVTSHLRPLVGLEADAVVGSERRAEAFAAWRRFLEELAAERPLVLVFEDLHWADDDLLDFVDHLVDRTADVSVLVLCTARPELLERRPAWGGGKPNALTVSLSPLSEDETSRLIGELVERPLLDAETQSELLARAGGNPLYAEQFTRMLLERGDAGAMPETVQGIVAARLDLLEAGQKSLIRDAAVLGRTFWAGGVAAMGGLDRFNVEEQLHPLELKHFVRRERSSTVADDSQYTFLHVLVRDVAYSQIPRAERAEKHRLAGDWIESLGRAEAHADLLAHHYLSALELAEAAGRDPSELTPKAARALAEAGDRAFALNAFAPAARFYERALDLTSDDDPGRPDLLLRCGRALFQFSDETEVTEAAAEGLSAVGDVEGAAEAELLLAELAWRGADRATSSVRLARAVSLLEDAPPSPGKARMLAETARYAALGGENERAIGPGQEAAAMAEHLGLEGLRAHALAYVGLAEGMLGNREGLRKLEESIAIYERLNSPEAGRIYNNLGSLLVTLGDLESAHETHRRGFEVVEQFGDLMLTRWLRHQLEVPWRYILGDWDAVLVAVEARLAGGTDYLDWDRYNCRARIRLARGDVVGALADVETSMGIARSAGDLQVLTPALSFAALAFTIADARDEANRLADDVLGHDLRHPIPHHSGPWIDLSWALVDLGRSEDLVAALGRVETWTVRADAAESVARGDYAAAARTYAEMGHRAAEAYARLRAAQAGQPGAGLEQAIAFFRKAGATAYLAEAESSIAASA